MREIYRGQFVYEKGHQACVKRRAALSLSMSGVCKVIVQFLLYDIIIILFMLLLSLYKNIRYFGITPILPWLLWYKYSDY